MSAAAERPPKKIVVIEDDPKTARLISTLLSRGEYEVVMASDGQEGLEKIRLHLPDLVITDILLPKKDGFAVLQAMKREPQLRRIPVVLLSAIYVSELDRRRALEMGADRFLLKPDAFLSKPFRSNQLTDAVQVLLGEKRDRPRQPETKPLLVLLAPPDRARRRLDPFVEASGLAVRRVDTVREAMEVVHLEDPVVAVIAGVEGAAGAVRALREENPDLAVAVFLDREHTEDPLELMTAEPDAMGWMPADREEFEAVVNRAVDRKERRVSRRKLTEQLKRTTSDLLDRIARLEWENRRLRGGSEGSEGSDSADVEEEAGDPGNREIVSHAQALARIFIELSAQLDLLEQTSGASPDARRKMVSVMRASIRKGERELEAIGQTLGRPVRAYLQSAPPSPATDR